MSDTQKRRRPGPRTYWKRHRIVRAIRLWAEEHGRPPTSKEWQKAAPGHPAAKNVRDSFGTWRAAVEAAGYEVYSPGPQQTWTQERVIESIRAWALKHGKPPSGNDWRRATPTTPSQVVVIRRFGSWNKALEAAGFWHRGPFGNVKVGRRWVSAEAYAAGGSPS